LYKRKMLEETGLFDGDFFAYSEDSDLGFRAQLQGWKCLYNPKSQLIHYHSKTSGGAGSPTKAFYTKRNSFLKVFKNCYFKDLIIYAVRDIKKYSSYLKQNNKNQSVDNLRKSIGTKGAILIVLKVYGSILFNLPKFLFKRVKIRQNQKISKKEYYNLFKKFSK